MLDGDLARLIVDNLDPNVRILMLCDACHSGGIMDIDTPGLWTGRKVVCVSGCQELQCATDTGDGGVMTHALLQAVAPKKTAKMRKRRQASVQYIFNRMVQLMPEDDEDEDAGEEDEEEDEERGPGFFERWFSWGKSAEEESDEEEDEMEEGDGVEPGQHLNLSWPSWCEPSKIAFPF